jgi:hypothetical protein
MKMLRNKLILGLMLALVSGGSVFGKMNVGSKPTTAPKNKKVAANCVTTKSQIDLDVNQVRARVLVGGDLWWDPVGQVPYYEVPIGSNKNSIFSGALWIGGFDQSNQLLVAAQTYRQNAGNDFWGGPISKDASTGGLNIDLARCNEFDRFWPVTRQEVEDFVANGTVSKSIREWPGNGNVANGELPFLAPFFDADNDGTYSFENGDYPYFNLSGTYPVDPVTGNEVCNDYLFGDKSIWWVFNDVGNVKTETNSNPIGLEVRSQAFAFNTTNDINFMTFYKYQIINRSSNELDSTYFGVWCDPDLGNAGDDYVGCDVGLGLGYCYNGDPDDEGGQAYGLNPPAVGIDFFQGPLADPGDGKDNNRDGRIDEPGEEIIMSRFVYYINVNNDPQGNPNTADDYYEYLSGFWLDGQPITYGGNGRGTGGGATTTPCNFMFPGTTDPTFSTPWTMVTANIEPDDMRWLQSAGTFTLLPGAVNYITTGVVWGRAQTGGPLASVSVIKRSDDLAQRLFNRCFQVLDGPDAPELAVRELDKKIILALENTKNSRVELYSQFDENIPGTITSPSGTDTLTTDQRSFKFQGYKIYQVIDRNVSVADIEDASKAKLIAQVDLNDSITKLVNFSFDNNLNAYVPVQKTEDVNQGITHTFEITNDLFTLQPLANYRPYYYLVLSYASNNFSQFDYQNPNPINQQAEPYLQGRRNVKVYSAIPHKPVVNNGGQVFNVDYGDGFEIRRIEGQGNGGNVLDLTQATVNEILNSPDHRAVAPVYQAGRGPIKVSVYDPAKVRTGGFRVMFDGVATTDFYGVFDKNAAVFNIDNINVIDDPDANDKDTLEITTSSPHGLAVGQFVMIDNVNGVNVSTGLNKHFFAVVRLDDTNDRIFKVLADGASGTFISGSGTAEVMIDRSTFPIATRNSQLLEANKISFEINKVNGQEPGSAGAPNNGFLEATLEFTDASKAWLTGVEDSESGASDWIRSGTAPDDFSGQDDNQVYENVLNGTWAPFQVVSNGLAGPKPPVGQSSTLQTFLQQRWSNVASVDLVITNDKSKWSRCVVFEMGEDTMPNINAARKFDKRKSPSVDKNGNTGDGIISNDPEDADFIDSVGMSWFPGYAINVETGERLNIAFGENSALTGQNSTDMRWNPNGNEGNDANGRLSFGGMHYIYIFNKSGSASTDVTTYDFGRRIDSLIGNTYSGIARRNIFKDCIWAGIPLVAPGRQLLETDAKIRLRVSKDYRVFASTGVPAVNNANPLYDFDIPASAQASVNVTEKAKSALDLIRVVPNPYYAYSTYEQTRADQLDNRVRITNLPNRCTVSIYTINGTLVRQFKRDVAADVSDGFAIEEGQDRNLATTLDWDLKNTAGITVSGGVYIIHIDAGSLGEKIVKWFGVMRPIDLDSF